MKNHFYKNISKCLGLTLCLAMSSTLFAIDFDEQRKVIIPKYANAVYRDLTVLDKMTLNATGSRVFLLELGKRPTFFWDTDHMFYTYLKSTLNLDAVNYTANSSNNGTFGIEHMNINSNGSFYSEDMLPSQNSIITMASDDSNLFLNHNEQVTANLQLLSPTSKYNVYSLVYGHDYGAAGSQNYQINEMYIRDLKFGTSLVQFPSPRAIVYYDDNKYKTEGSAIDFELVPVNKQVKHYFGPWEIHSTTLSFNNPCGTIPDNRCAYTITNSGGDVTQQPDSVDNIFDCDGSSADVLNVPVNPSNSCYDYQEVLLSSFSPYNNNNAYYEFKVEEVYRTKLDAEGNIVSELISQTPETRKLRTGDDKPIAFMQLLGSNWSLLQNNNLQDVIINGATLHLGNDSKKDPVIISSENSDVWSNPCFHLCDGKLCDRNILYIRENYSQRTLKGGDESGNLSNTWPLDNDLDKNPPDDLKQDLRILTYTVGFCPQRTGAGNNNYSDYEDNFKTLKEGGKESKIIDALLIKVNGNTPVAPVPGSGSWTTPRVCLKRVVHCDHLHQEQYSRHYKLLSTDY